MNRAIASAKFPSCLEPAGLYRADDKRPDSITVVPWKCGKLLIWDATCCPDTFVSSYLSSATTEAGAVATLAEARKISRTLDHLDPVHSFTPVAIETSGVLGPESMAFLKDLERHLTRMIGEEKKQKHHLSSAETICGSAAGQQCLDAGHDCWP